MEVKSSHLGIINFALKTRINERGEIAARQIELEEQGAALEVVNKIKGLTADGGVNERGEKLIKFLDGEIDLSTEAKALVLKLIKRPWGADDLEAKKDVEEMLK